MNNLQFNSQSGKSLMEIVIVLTVASVLVTFTVAQFGGSSRNFNRQNIAREFKVSLERTRFDSVKRRAIETAKMARVTINSATSFSLTTDLNQNGVLDANDTQVIDFSGQSDVRIVGNGLVFPITILFDYRGHIRVLDGSMPPQNVTPYFVFCNGSCTTSTATASNSNIIMISATGTINMMAGGTAVPTYQNPTVTTVANNSQVNPLLTVWANNTTSTTPTPTPTATPTPTPTITPTPTVTPTQVACTYGQRPLSTGCICVAPMWVRSSGKCQ